MRTDAWKRLATAAFLTIALVVAGTALADARQATSGLSHYTDVDGHHYVTGCVTFELAEHLVARAGFEYGNAGAPALISCAEGYTQVGKKLN